jgi:hypothetical protein
MMFYLHHRFELGPDEVIEAIIDRAANVLLLDPENYEDYRQGRTYQYAGGGYATESPVRMQPPRPGTWHLVVDLGGGPGSVRATALFARPRELDSRWAKKPALSPPVRFAGLGESSVYLVYEHDLDRLAQGSPASVMLNFALFFLGVAMTALGTLWTAPPQQDRVYYTFLIVFLATLMAGVVLLVLWWFQHQSMRNVVKRIKSQIPPNPEVGEAGTVLQV